MSHVNSLCPVSDVCVNLKLGLFVIFWSIIIKQLLRYFDHFDDGATLIEVLIVFVLFIKTKKLYMHLNEFTAESVLAYQHQMWVKKLQKKRFKN